MEAKPAPVLCTKGLRLFLTASVALWLGLATSMMFSVPVSVQRTLNAESRAEAEMSLALEYERAGEKKAPPRDASDPAGGQAPAAQPAAARAAARAHYAGAATAGAAASEQLGDCFILVDRHNHKTGGTTVREIMEQNARYGDCVYWGYGQDEPHWGNFVDRAERLLPKLAANASAPPLKLCLEAHFPVFHFMDKRVGQIAKLRDAAGTAGRCRVLLTTRVREPLSFYLSYFKWDIMGRQLKGEKEFGASFVDWAPPNLQTNALWNAFSTEFASRYYDVRNPKRWRSNLDMSNGTFAKVKASLDRFDVVGTVEDFDASLLLTADLLGARALPRLQYERKQPVHRHRDPKLPPFSSAEVCPDMDKCAAHVRRIAPLDHALYDTYARRFRERVAALGEPFAARVAAFKAARTGAWVGGSDPRAAEEVKCDWAADGDAEDFRDNPCRPSVRELGELVERCMGITGKNKEHCCIRFKPLAPGGSPQAIYGKQFPEWHIVWHQRVCGMRNGACRNPRLPSKRKAAGGAGAQAAGGIAPGVRQLRGRRLAGGASRARLRGLAPPTPAAGPSAAPPARLHTPAPAARRASARAHHYSTFDHDDRIGDDELGG